MAYDDEAFDTIWKDLLRDKPVKPMENPKGYVLGGQPGAGKSKLISLIEQETKGNVIAINGDEFRKYHPEFALIQAEYGKEAPKHTAEFAGKMTERAIGKALSERYNVVVEGTFRTAETPLRTLTDMKGRGYHTSVYIMTTGAQTSWHSTLERYQKMLDAGEAARYTDKAHHDKVVAELPKNADTVFQSGKADDFKVYSREGLIFDKQEHHDRIPGAAIFKELHRDTLKEELNPIIQNDRDQRVYDWLREQVGEEKIREACLNLAGNRKPYLSNIAKQLKINLPESLAKTPKTEAREHLAALKSMLEGKKKPDISAPRQTASTGFYESTERLAADYAVMASKVGEAQAREQTDRMAAAAGLKIDWAKAEAAQLADALEKSGLEAKLKDGTATEMERERLAGLNRRYPTLTLNRVFRNASEPQTETKAQKQNDVLKQKNKNGIT